jgi:hypothetical protein
VMKIRALALSFLLAASALGATYTASYGAGPGADSAETQKAVLARIAVLEGLNVELTAAPRELTVAFESAADPSAVEEVLSLAGELAVMPVVPPLECVFDFRVPAGVELVPDDERGTWVVTGGSRADVSLGTGSYWSAEPNDDGHDHFYVLDENDRLDLTGRIAEASVSAEPYGPAVSLTLDGDAAEEFAAFTGSHIGARAAVCLDGEVLVAPVVQERIAGGRILLTGLFTEERATYLARALDLPPLPPDVRLLELRNP